MRYATVRLNDGETRGAWREGNEFVLTSERDAVGAMNAGAPDDGERIPVDGAALASPTLRPRKVICVGLNYETHILEMGRDLPAYPTLFAKFDRTLIGPNDTISLPTTSDEVDWEAELGIVVGQELRHASPSESRAAIGGYCVVNDISMRDWQWRTTQWLGGKAFEGTTPVGPEIVTPDEVDHAKDLRLTCEVDGEMMQESRTSDLVFSPADILSYISSIVTLDPGDLIATGTPGGVGSGRNPKVFLRQGQVVRTAIEGLGELVNVCENSSV